ncbi:uncharacterized protein PG986_001877 [Apiospora aurea]|uniref:Integrase zinc-binding domain-containing protein n=1 Tax=Apiospora aurea TaxID=335848 RepID=A0ABR1QY32_9PEZI
MSDSSAEAPFSPSTKTEFQQYLIENPSHRRVSQSERDQFLQWLTADVTRPSSQKEFSRRNYVRRSFIWDDITSEIHTTTGSNEEGNRVLVTDDCIMDVVESVHIRNQHAGWDRTWNDIRKSYYGILRADVIFLLRRCLVCAKDPRKRPKDSTRAFCDGLSDNDTASGLFALDDFINEHSTA